jgi:ArsR family transcriptional regulator
MDSYKTQAQLFKALMHPTRLAILDELRDGEQCVCHMEAKFGLRQAYISQHLMVLRDTGLVIDRRDGWNIYYQVSKPEIYQVIDAMDDLTKMAYIEPSAHAHATVRSSEKQHPCPCPKCNAKEGSPHGQSHDMALNEAEAAI